MKRYIRYILASITLAASGKLAAGLALCPHAFNLDILNGLTRAAEQLLKKF